MRTVAFPREMLLAMLDGNANCVISLDLQSGVENLRAIPVPDQPWVPLTCIPTPRHIVENHEKAGIPVPTNIWQNDIYEVFVTEDESGMTYLSIKRYDRQAIHNWRHFQQIKNEICGTEREGIEVYPRESRLADNANQYHMHVLPPGLDVPVGFSGGMVIRRDDEVEAMNTNGSRARQEPMQEGLTVGETMQAAQDAHASQEDPRRRAIIQEGRLS